MSKLVMANKEYREWITSLSQEFKTSQIRATIKVNEEMAQKLEEEKVFILSDILTVYAIHNPLRTCT